MLAPQWLNATGQYALFSSRWFHWGYFNRRLKSIFVRVQLFAVSSDKPDVNWHTRSCSQVKNQTMLMASWMCQGMVQAWVGQKPVNVTFYEFLPCPIFARHWKKYAEGRPLLQWHGFIKSTPLEGRAAPRLRHHGDVVCRVVCHVVCAFCVCFDS